eukprot:6750257-Ditylum_brightwellii.AAC.1
MDKQKADYCYSDVMSFALKMHSNQKALGKWKTKDIPAKKKTEKDQKFLAPLTQMKAISKSVGGLKIPKSNVRNGRDLPGEVYSFWRYQNPDNKEIIQKENRMLNGAPITAIHVPCGM